VGQADSRGELPKLLPCAERKQWLAELGDSFGSDHEIKLTNNNISSFKKKDE
jgi:hypothetical protein